jgi:predicted transcriptional regulator
VRGLGGTIDAARELRGKGMSVRGIAERLGISRSSAHEYVSDPDTKARYNARRRRRQQRAAQTHDALLALESRLRDEIDRLRATSSVAQWQQADRLQAILDDPAASPSQEGER